MPGWALASEPSRHFFLTDSEWRVLLLALNRMRSKLIAQGRYTDAVDEIIRKMAG